MSSTATAKQIAFYTSLVTQAAALDPALAAVADVALDAFPARTVADASEAIERAKRTLDRLKAAAPAPVAPVAPVAVADGHYALVDADGVTKFYEVNSPTQGKWAGRTFVAVQASDERYPIRGAAAKAILAAIAADPKAALVRYGHAIGKCGVCNRTLTDEASRAAGIGPVCAGRL
jgi:Family of unknown function (DUF6011)